MQQQEDNILLEAAKKGGKFVGNVLFLPVRATMYLFNPRNLFNSWDQVKHDASNALGEIVGIPKKQYRSPIEMLQSSRDFGVEADVRDGKLSFSASRTLTGDIPNLSRKQVDEIEKKYDITVNRGKNTISLNLSVEKIVEEARSERLSEKEVRTLAIEEIADKIGQNLKGLGKITGGLFSTYKDSRLMYSIGRRLYEDYEETTRVVTLIDNPSVVPHINKPALRK